MARPTAPNFVDVANQQGALNKQTAFDIANANSYTRTDAAGNQNVWGVDPQTGVRTNTTTMGAKPQAYYDALMGGGTTATNSFMNQYYGPGAAQGGGGGSASAGMRIEGMPQGNDPNSPVNKGIQKNLDYSNLTAMPGEDIGLARQQAQDALYGRSTGYLDPQWQQAEASTRTRLSNQGLVPGTAAYNNAYANEAAAKEKAYTGARQDAITGGGLEAARAQEMALALRNQGVLEAGNLGAFHNAAQDQGAKQYLTQRGQDTALSGQLGAAGISAGASMSNNASDNALALRKQQYLEATGMGGAAQEYLPQFGTSQGNVGTYKPADIEGATLAQYQDQVDRYNAAKAKKGGALGTLGTIAGGVAGAYFGGPLGASAGAKIGGSLGNLSDVRLKSNIWPVGQTQGGHNVYDYDILGHRERGVMAQEVRKMLPEAVTRGDDGFLRVDYSKVR